jgi:hypothetical protein
MGMRIGLLLLACALAPHQQIAANGDPRAVWEQAIQAKGGRDRLHNVHSLAVYMKPADVNMAGPPANWLCVFPDRYFEFEAMGHSAARAIVVDGTADRAAIDITGIPRTARHVSSSERDQLVLNQLVFLLESAWLQPQPVEARHNVLEVQAAGRTYKLFLNSASLPERVLSLPIPGEKHANTYDYRLQHYREFQGVMLPGRVVWIGGLREWIWDVDYEIDAKYNPKLFERMPDLANGPEPWRLR